MQESDFPSFNQPANSPTRKPAPPPTRRPANSPTRRLASACVTVIGLGLMGGSLAWALRERRACREVVGVARREETASLAVERGVVDRATCDITEGVRDAEVVVLATPVRTIIRLLGEIGPLLPEGCLVMDVGSTKREIVAAMERLPPHVHPLGGHPMCGKEKAGLGAAEPGLYEGRVFVLTPLSRTPPEAVELGRELVEALGARPVIMDAERHDYIVAAVSHLPYLLACGLVATAEELSRGEDALWQLAASGFRDTSRLAASEVTMMLDILLTNRGPVLEALTVFESQLRELARLLEEGDEGRLKSFLETVARRRRGECDGGAGGRAPCRGVRGCPPDHNLTPTCDDTLPASGELMERKRRVSL